MTMRNKNITIELMKFLIDNEGNWYTTSELYQNLGKGEERVRYVKRMSNILGGMADSGLIERKFTFVKVDGETTTRNVYRWIYGGKCENHNQA